MQNLTVRHAPGEPVTLATDGIRVEGLAGTWWPVDLYVDDGGRLLFELEDELRGSEAAHIIVDEDGGLVLDGVRNGYGDYEAFIAGTTSEQEASA
jgi:hypothetical protein